MEAVHIFTQSSELTIFFVSFSWAGNFVRMYNFFHHYTLICNWSLGKENLDVSPDEIEGNIEI